MRLKKNALKRGLNLNFCIEKFLEKIISSNLAFIKKISKLHDPQIFCKSNFQTRNLETRNLEFP